MAISPTAIDSFLRQAIPYVPQFKGMDPHNLRELIRYRSGIPYEPKTEPRPHQLEGIAFAMYQGRSLLYYGMRLGKTLMSLQWAEQLRRGGLWKGKGLIICHAPIALDVWQSEAEKHSNLRVVPVRNQAEELADALESDADLIVIPWSGLQNIFTDMRKNRKGANKLYPDLEGARILADAVSLVIIDEIHAAKNWSSLRFKLAKEIVCKCRYRLGLTGTPFGRNPYDVWAQCYLIDEGKTLGYNPQFFEAAFGTRKQNWFSGRDEYTFDKKKQPILEQKLTGIALPYKLEECQHVPVYPGSVELNIIGDQLTAYRECIDKLINLDNNQSVEIQATFVRLRQISSGYLPFIDAFGNELTAYFKNNSKLEWLRDFLETAKEAGIAMVIIHEFTNSGRLICKALEEVKVSHHWLHGATKDKPGVCKDFQAGKVDAIVVQAATGGLAIDLHRADYLLFFESPVSPILRAQVEARPLSQARGDKTLLMEDIICSGIERKIQAFLKEGKDLMSAIIHERQSLLDETGESNGKDIRCKRR